MSAPLPQCSRFKIEVFDKVALLSYDRPKSGNSLHPATMRSFRDCLRWADNDPNIRVIVQTGTGKFFTTGKELVEDDNTTDTEGEIQIFQEINEILIVTKKITIAAVNGPGIGYGMSCLPLYDLVYSVPHAYFFTPFVKWGLCAEGCSSVTFMKSLGFQKAAAVLLTGEKVTADELCAAGMISKILPADTFMPQVMETAQKLASSPPHSLFHTKALMKRVTQEELLAANVTECYALRERLVDSECQEALKGFGVEQEARRKIKREHKM